MGEGVGGRPVGRQRGPDANPADHVPDLADDVVRQQPARIVLEHGVDDAVDRHDRSQPDQDLGAGEAPDQDIDRRFGGEGGHEDRSGDRSLGVGVR